MGVAHNTARTDVASRCLRCMLSVLYMPMWFVSAECSFVYLVLLMDKISQKQSRNLKFSVFRILLTVSVMLEQTCFPNKHYSRTDYTLSNFVL